MADLYGQNLKMATNIPPAPARPNPPTMSTFSALTIASRSPDNSLFLLLPFEIRLEIFTSCTAYSLLNLSHTNNQLRAEINTHPKIVQSTLGYYRPPLLTFSERVRANLDDVPNQMQFIRRGESHIDMTRTKPDHDKAQDSIPPIHQLQFIGELSDVAEVECFMRSLYQLYPKIEFDKTECDAINRRERDPRGTTCSSRLWRRSIRLIKKLQIRIPCSKCFKVFILSGRSCWPPRALLDLWYQEDNWSRIHACSNIPKDQFSNSPQKWAVRMKLKPGLVRAVYTGSPVEGGYEEETYEVSSRAIHHPMITLLTSFFQRQ